MRKRPIEVKIRLSQAESDLLAQKVEQAGVTRNSFFLQLIKRGEAITKGEIKTANLLLYGINRQLQGMAANLNQIAKACNRTGAVPPASIIALAEEVRQLRKASGEVWWEVRKLYGDT